MPFHPKKDHVSDHVGIILVTNMIGRHLKTL